MGKTLQKRISEVHLRPDDILQIDILSGVHFEIDDMHDLIDAAQEIGSGRKFLNLIHVGDSTLPNHEARNYSSSVEGSRLKLADAFVISSAAQKIVGNFYMKFHKPVVPTRFFQNTEEAVAWLLAINKESTLV